LPPLHSPVGQAFQLAHILINRMKPRQILLLAALLLSVALLSVVLSRTDLNGLNVSVDFVQYWSAGSLNVRGQNPYDLELLAAVQSPYVRAGEPALIMWLPPWVYPLIMPVGLLPYSFARMGWFFGQIVLLFACVNWLWISYQGSKAWLWLAWWVAFSQWAVLEALHIGQVSPFVLAGAVLFLALIQRGRAGWAGAVLSLVLLKPHLLYLFSLGILVWVVQQRRWRLLGGLAGAVAAGLLLASITNPQLLLQYVEITRQSPPTQWVTATIGGQLRLWFGAQHVWLQFLPVVFGVAWLSVHWLRRQRRPGRAWEWQEELPLLALLSLSTAAYGWRHDQTVLLLAILPACGWLVTSRRPLALKIIFFGLYGLLDWIAISSQQPQNWFWWMPLAMLVWYLAVQKVFREAGVGRLAQRARSA